MKYIDISRTIITGMERYPSDPPVQVRQFKSLTRGNSCNLKKITFGSHSGTHIDAPRHIFNRASAVDNIQIKNLIRDVIVVDIRKLLQEEFFSEYPKDVKGVLLKKTKDKYGLTLKEAERLVANSIKLVGNEGMSIEESRDKFHPVHRLLLGKGVIIIENLDLNKVKPGRYKLICLPLKLEDGDGAPARAVLGYD